MADTQAIALLTGRPAATIRSWAHRGKLTRHGTDDRGRALYDVEEAEKLATRGASFEKPVTSCNTDRTTGSRPASGEEATMAALSNATYGVAHQAAREHLLAPDDGHLEVRIAPGTVIDGAIVALCPDAHGVVTADVCIPGPPRK